MSEDKRGLPLVPDSPEAKVGGVTRPQVELFRGDLSSLSQGVQLVADGTVVLCREGDRVQATRNRCRHMGGTFRPRSSSGEDCVLKCSSHGWELDASTMTYVNPGGGLTQRQLTVTVAQGEVVVVEPVPVVPWEDRCEGARASLGPGELVIQFMAHACVEIQAGATRVFTDPWLEGPAFTRGWWLAHRPPADALQRLAGADAIYISHNHSDHLNVHTLRLLLQLNADVRLLVPRFDVGRLDVTLGKMGFRNVQRVTFDTWVDLGPDLRMMMFLDDTGREDSAALFEYRGVRVLDTVDCHSPRGNRLPSVDVLLSHFAGGASGFPVCWEELYGEDWVRRRVQQNLVGDLRQVQELVEVTRPALYAPIAGYFSELHPSDQDIRLLNRKHSAHWVCTKVAQRFPQVQTWAPEPGARMDVATGEVTPMDPARGTLPLEMDAYVHAIARDGDFGPLKHLQGVQAYFDWAGYQGNLLLHVVETDETFAQVLRECCVDFRECGEGGGVVQQGPPEDATGVGVPYLRMRVRSDVFRHVMRRGYSWEEISIGFQARFFRVPDQYHFGFWDHFQNGLPADPPFLED